MNLIVPTYTITELEGIAVSNTNILLKWTYTYSISESHMNSWYYLESEVEESGVVAAIEIKIGDIGWEYDPSRVDTRYYVVRNLELSTTYSFKLRLVNAVGYGAFGTPIKVRTGGQGKLLIDFFNTVEPRIIRNYLYLTYSLI